MYRAQDSSFGYCLDLLRRYDHDQFLVNLVQPNTHRRAHAAIRAFNVELTRIRQIVTNEDLGRLRVTFFREALERAFAATPDKQPVLDLLSEAIVQFGLSKKWFERLLSAREADLSLPNFQTIQEVEHFTESTQSSLLYAYLETFGKRQLSLPVYQAASHLGQALGLTILLRGTRHHIESRLCYFPKEWIQKYRVDLPLHYRGLWKESNSIATARQYVGDIPPLLFPAFLSSTIVDVYLAKIRRYHYQMLDPRVEFAAKLGLKLLWNKWRRRF
ncbi:NADH dehydrogenase (ubiquinone) complex I, assembly factor 6 [Galdieria sulphuraria]|nr:NADH dehydrogenase (ubiquinone) complex I, assembly factor 6 [Galdieria sulphuraria]